MTSSLIFSCCQELTFLLFVILLVLGEEIVRGGVIVKFNFDWNYVSNGAPYVTISSLALGLNTPSSSLLGNPEEVIVGFDSQNMIIGIKKYDGIENTKSYKFYSRMKNGWVRIGCKDFIKHLSFLTGLDFVPAKRYVAQFDPDEKILFISVLDTVKTKEEGED